MTRTLTAGVTISPIRSDAEHRAALMEIERLWGAAPGTPDSDRLDVLATLADAYERSRWPVEDVDPVQMLEARMEATGRTRADLAKIVGSRGRAAEIMNRRRALTLGMIQALTKQWDIPADLLIGRYRLRAIREKCPPQVAG